MYQGDKTLRGTDEKIDYTPELLQEYIRCKEDIVYFAEKYFYITTLDKGRVIPKLWEFQKRCLKVYVDPNSGLPEQNQDKRHIVFLAARQIGKTTISKIYMTHYILFNKDKNVAILANKEKTALKILWEIKESYKNLPLWLQQGVADAGWNKSSINLENGSRVIAASTASSAIRGETISLLYLDEFAFVPQNIADDFMRSVYPTISSGKTSKIIIVSTPHGLNHFYHIYRNAIRGENEYRAIKVNWDEVPGRDEKFKESVIRNNDIIFWNQEYGCKFLGSSNILIDSEILERMDTTEPVDTKLGDLLQIYEQPQEGVMYILGVDSGKGTGRDFSVIQVLKILDEFDVEQVAIYRHNMIEPYGFAQVCIETSKFYNGAYMMVENNDVGSSVTDSIWYNFEYDKIINCDKKGLGIRSTKKSKLAANILLKRYLENGWLNLVDKRTVFELSRYEEVAPNIFRAGNHEHDDCVTSLLWGVYFLSTTFFDGKNLNVHRIDEKFKIQEDNENSVPPTIFDEGPMLPW